MLICQYAVFIIDVIQTDEDVIDGGAAHSVVFRDHVVGAVLMQDSDISFVTEAVHDRHRGECFRYRHNFFSLQ